MGAIFALECRLQVFGGLLRLLRMLWNTSMTFNDILLFNDTLEHRSPGQSSRWSWSCCRIGLCWQGSLESHAQKLSKKSNSISSLVRTPVYYPKVDTTDCFIKCECSMLVVRCYNLMPNIICYWGLMYVTALDKSKCIPECKPCFCNLISEIDRCQAELKSGQFCLHKPAHRSILAETSI